MNNPEYIETHIEKPKKILKLKKPNKISILDLDEYTNPLYIKMNNSIYSTPFIITNVEVGSQSYESSTEIKLTLISIY